MRCVERTYEYLDGLALVALLRANNLDAQLFDENFVRQDWFYIMVYGGFRVMVPTHEFDSALSLRDAYFRRELSLKEDECEDPTCPSCDWPSGQTDLVPRRRVFAAFFLGYFLIGFQVAFAIGNAGLFVASTLVFSLPLLFPNLLRHLVIGRYRCSVCGHAWKAIPDRPFFEQQIQAEAALDSIS
ncbi:MAG: hypothetical protein ABI866_13765 [Dokdonella sp.]